MNKHASLLLAAVLLVAVSPARAALKVGDSFPSLASVGLVGAALPETAGKVVLVDFWASWCAPCKASFPSYARLNQDYAPKGLVIVAVSVDEVPGAYQAFLGKYAPPFYVALDRNHELVGKVEVPTMPTCYLVDRDGRIRSVHAGFHGESSERTLRAEIEALLSAKTS